MFENLTDLLLYQKTNNYLTKQFRSANFSPVEFTLNRHIPVLFYRFYFVIINSHLDSIPSNQFTYFSTRELAYMKRNKCKFHI